MERRNLIKSALQSSTGANSTLKHRHATPQLIESLQGVVEIVCGAEHCFAITQAHDVYAWGANHAHQLGIAKSDHGADAQTIPYPRIVEQLRGKHINHISTGVDHSFAWSDETAEVYGWGSRDKCKLGFGEGRNVIPEPELFAIFTEASQYGWRVKTLSCGATCSMAIISTSQSAAREGEGHQEEDVQHHPHHPHHRAFESDSGAGNEAEDREEHDHQESGEQQRHHLHDEQIAPTHAHNNGGSSSTTTNTRVNTEEKQLFVWGSAANWQLGLEHYDAEELNAPHQLDFDYWDGRIDDVLATAGFALARSEGGDVYAWGTGEFGRLGTQSKQQKVPKQVSALSGVRVVQIAVGAYHCAAVTDRGALYTWGRGINGQLGHGSNTNVEVPTEVKGIVQAAPKQRVIGVACGESHTLALTDSDDVLAFGSAPQGQLGLGDFSRHYDPVVVRDLTGRGVVRVQAGRRHSLALTRDGSVYAWGCNQQGQLGLAIAPPVEVQAQKSPASHTSHHDSASGSMSPYAHVGGVLQRHNVMQQYQGVGVPYHHHLQSAPPAQRAQQAVQQQHANVLLHAPPAIMNNDHTATFLAVEDQHLQEIFASPDKEAIVRNLLHENRYLRHRVKELELKENVDAQHEQTFELCNNTFRAVEKVCLEGHQSAQQAIYKNQQLDLILQDFKKEIEEQKHSNMHSTYFYSTILQKVIHLVKRLNYQKEEGGY